MQRAQVFILCRDRVSFLDEALQSVLTQDVSDFEVIVSDNSEHDDVGVFIKSKYPEVKYIRRQPALPALEHFRVVFGECDKQYAVLFHDDDVMMPDYVRQMVNAMDRDPSIAAVGCNASILCDKQTARRRLVRTVSRAEMFYSPESILEPYLGFGLRGVAPFPGYMYRTSAIAELYLDASEGGKYSDVSFLLKVLRRGPILWLPDVLIQYRIHSGNDTNCEVIGQRLSLIRFIYRNTQIRRKSRLIDEFRFAYWRRWLMNNISYRALRTRRFRVVARFVCRMTLKLLMTQPGFWIRISNKLT